jgi:hypothetical protein
VGCWVWWVAGFGGLLGLVGCWVWWVAGFGGLLPHCQKTNHAAFFASEKTELGFYEISKFGRCEELQRILYSKIALRGHLGAFAYPPA